MELLCPNCQKKLTVPEQYAGQIMRCPLCQGTFNVPSMPSAAAAGSTEPFGFFAPPMKSETAGVGTEAASAAPTLPPISSETPSAASSAPHGPAAGAPPATPSSGYSRVCVMKFNPQLVQWLPLGLVLGFLLTFFPWISEQGLKGAIVSPSRNAWSIAFGKNIEGPLGKIEVPAHGLLIIFLLLAIVAALLAIASLLITLKVIPDVPALKIILPLRSLIVGGVAGLGWLCLSLQYVIWLLADGMVPINFLGVLAWWIYTIAVAGALIEFWLEMRGPEKALPRMSMEW
jgi:hypothetical protein